jgi:sec-independent protein translocase protein TatA
MNIFGIGLPEMILIMLVALLIFGPKKLPEIGRSMGKAIKGFQDASREFESEFKREADRLEQTVSAPATATTTEVKTTASDELKEATNATDAG